MKSICEHTYFPPVALRHLERATQIVAEIPDDLDEKEIRCHEVARVVGTILRLDVVDGAYGYVDHSWCMITNMAGKNLILDPYAVGRLPQVQLVDFYPNSLYRSRGARDDIREDVVRDILSYLSRCGIHGVRA